MKSFEQYVASTYILEEISLEEAEQLLELAMHTGQAINRDLTGDDNDQDLADKKKNQPKPMKTVVHVKNTSGASVRTYHDPAQFNRNKAMHVAANHTFHKAQIAA